jgi:hypothetical protein
MYDFQKWRNDLSLGATHWTFHGYFISGAAGASLPYDRTQDAFSLQWNLSTSSVFSAVRDELIVLWLDMKREDFE